MNNVRFKPVGPRVLSIPVRTVRKVLFWVCDRNIPEYTGMSRTVDYPGYSPRVRRRESGVNTGDHCS